MKNKKKTIVIVFLFLSLLSGLLFYFRHNLFSKKENNLIIEKVKRGNLLITVETYGIIIPYKRVDVRSKIQGRIKNIFTDEGNKVTAGDLIAQIDPEEFKAKLDESQADIQIAKTNLQKIKLLSILQKTQNKNKIAQAEKILQQARVKLQETERNLVRINQLREKGFVSQSEVDNAQTAFDIANSHLEDVEIELKNAKENFEITEKSSEQELKLAEARVRQAEASLKFAKENLNYTNITSPISGIVTFKGVEIGEVVASESFGKTSGTTIATISDLTSLFIEAKLDEVDIGMIKVGQSVNADLEAFPDYKIRGHISKIALQSSNLDNNGGTSSFLVRIKISNPSKKLKPGMNCNVNVIVSNIKNTLYIPIESTIKENDKEFVNVRVKNKKEKIFKNNADTSSYRKKEIKTGLNNMNFVQVLDGLKEGEEIVIPISESETEKKKRWGH